MRLTTHLLLTTVSCAAVVFVLALGWILHSEHRRAASDLSRTAATIERILEGQLVGLREGAALTPRFPEWTAVAVVPRAAGSCLRIRHPDHRLWRSECRGQSDAAAHVPAWFTAAYRRLFMPAHVERRTVETEGRLRARLELIADPQVETASSWRETRRMAGLMAIAVGSVCLLLWWSMRRALQPTYAIMTELERIDRGEGTDELGPFRYVELNRIAQASNRLAASLAERDRERARLTLRLMQVQEDERRSLARDLHDEFGQHLTALGATLAALRMTGSDEVREDLLRMEDSVRHLQQLVRDLLSRLRPPGLDELGLAGSLSALAADWDRRCAGRPSVRCRSSGDLADLPAHLASEVYRIVQECLTNAVRHANAGTVDVVVARNGLSTQSPTSAEAITISIADDGSGIEATELREGLGLTGLRERAAAVGGDIAFVHNESGGLTVTVRLPLVAAYAASPA